LQAVIKGALAILEKNCFNESMQMIFNHCRDLANVISSCVALLSNNSQENKVLFLQTGGICYSEQIFK